MNLIWRSGSVYRVPVPVPGGNLEEHHPAWWIVSDKSISMARQATEMKQRLREIHWHLLDREKLRIRVKASNL